MEQKDSVSLEAYSMLKNKIITMELMPGQTLIAQQLSNESGLSRTPVREALIRLENIGFVQSIAGGKYRVTNLTWKFIVDFYNTRSILESAAMQAVSPDLTERDYAELEQYNQIMEQALNNKELDLFFDNDQNFHNFFLLKYGNQIICDWFERLNDSQLRIRFITAGVEGRMQNSILEHQNIISCLRTKDVDAAVEALQDHLESVVESIEQLRDDQFATARHIIKW